MTDLKIAAVCMNSPPGEIDHNLEKIESFSDEASEKGVDVICFPELSITGYVLKNPKKILSAALSEKIIESVAKIARKRGMIVIAGTIELSGKKGAYISQIVAGPQGLLGIYRKTHLSPAEKEFFQPGDDVITFSQDNFSFGVQLCYESHFPEISTIMALKGAEMIFMPHASPRGTPGEKIRSWLRHLPARAFDNALFIVACNQVGKGDKSFSFPGAAVVLNPSGRIICRYAQNQERMVLADLKMDELGEIRGHRMKYFLPHRRPELYQTISTDHE